MVDQNSLYNIVTCPKWVLGVVRRDIHLWRQQNSRFLKLKAKLEIVTDSLLLLLQR